MKQTKKRIYCYSNYFQNCRKILSHKEIWVQENGNVMIDLLLDF